MDELLAVKRFRNDVAADDADARARARAALDALLAGPRGRTPRWRSKAVLATVVALLAGVVAVSSAFGWTQRLIDLVAGEPAPPPVRQAFAIHNGAFGAKAFPIFRHDTASEVIVARAHGVLGIDSSAGPIYIWAAPTKAGGECWVMDVVRNRLPGGRPNGGGGCSPYAPRPAATPLLNGGIAKSRMRDGSILTLVEGRTRPAVAKVELLYADGTVDELPVFEGFFLAEPRAGLEPRWLVAYDADGHELRRQKLRDPMPSRPRMPMATGPFRVLFDFETAAGFRLTFSIAPAPNGQICSKESYRGGVGSGCGPDPRDRVGPHAVDVHPGLRSESRDGTTLILLDGVVGADVATLEVHYEDGTVAAMPIIERFVHFEIPPAHHHDKRFTVVGRNHAGDEVGRGVIS